MAVDCCHLEFDHCQKCSIIVSMALHTLGWVPIEIEQKNLVLEVLRVVVVQKECTRIHVSFTRGTLIMQYKDDRKHLLPSPVISIH